MVECIQYLSELEFGHLFGIIHYLKIDIISNVALLYFIKYQEIVYFCKTERNI